MTSTALSQGSPGIPAGKKVLSDPVAGVLAELLFVLLPLLVLLIAFGVNGPNFWSRILHAPDWSFASSVLYGQSIVKFVSGITARPEARPWARVALIVSAVIVIFLVPTLVILACMLLISTVPLWTVLLQILLFIGSIVSFLTLGVVGQQLIDR